MRRSVWLVLAAILAVGCDSGPDGPGDLTGSVSSSDVPLGAVVLEVVGGGIEGFSGAGGTKVFWAQQENPVVYRVIVVAESGGDVSFTTSVRDRGGRKPRATVVAAVNDTNSPIPATGDLRVSFRP